MILTDQRGRDSRGGETLEPRQPRQALQGVAFNSNWPGESSNALGLLNEVRMFLHISIGLVLIKLNPRGCPLTPQIEKASPNILPGIGYLPPQKKLGIFCLKLNYHYFRGDAVSQRALNMFLG